MSIEDDIFAMDAAFIAGDAFGEQVTYQLPNGQQTKCNAVVDRQPAEHIEGGPIGASRRNFIVELPVQTITWTPRVGDVVIVAETKNSSTMLTMRVESLLSQDAGMWRVRLA